MSQLFASGGQSIGASASALVLPVNIQFISLNLHPLDQKSQNKDSNPSIAMIVLIGKWRMEILS